MGAHVYDKKENLSICSCPDRPMLKDSELKSALYCARGEAEEDVVEAGCNCSFCRVADKYALEFEYYYVRGKSADIP
jgi:Protein of unknown function (DUF2769)